MFPNIKRKRSLEMVNKTVVARLDNVTVAKFIESLNIGNYLVVYINYSNYGLEKGNEI